MSAGFFKAPNHTHKEAKKAPALYSAKVLTLFPQKHTDTAVIQAAIKLQKKHEIDDAKRYQNSVRALVQQTRTTPGNRPGLFSAPKPALRVSKSRLLAGTAELELELKNAERNRPRL